MSKVRRPHPDPGCRCLYFRSLVANSRPARPSLPERRAMHDDVVHSVITGVPRGLIGEMTVAKSFDMLERGEDHMGILSTIEGVNTWGSRCGLFPVLHDWVPWLSHKAKIGVWSAAVLHRTGLTGWPDRSNRWGDWSDQWVPLASRSFEAEDMRCDREACVELKRIAVGGRPFDGDID